MCPAQYIDEYYTEHYKYYNIILYKYYKQSPAAGLHVPGPVHPPLAPRQALPPERVLRRLPGNFITL